MEKRFKITSFKVPTSSTIEKDNSNSLNVIIAKDVMTITNTGEQSGKYIVNDMTGRQVTSGNFGNGTLTVPLSSLSKGAYIIQATAGKEKQTVKTIIK